MRKERDISIPSRGQTSSAARRQGGLLNFFKSGRRPVRRGEREAHNLLWRRRLKVAERICTAAFLVGIVAFGIEAWRGGAINQAGQDLHAGIDHMLVRAGLTVDEVRIQGQDRTPLGEIRSALEIQPGQSIFAVNLNDARARIEGLSWVKAASVSRQLPNSIKVDIVERTPMALWQDKGHLWLIDSDGVRLTDRDMGRFHSLPMVVGDGAPEKAASLLTLLKSDPSLYARIKASVRVSGRRWDLIFANGVRVRLPDDKVGQAYARLATFQKDTQILERDVNVVDLRFPGRLVLRLDHNLGKAGRSARETRGGARSAHRRGKEI